MKDEEHIKKIKENYSKRAFGRKTVCFDEGLVESNEVRNEEEKENKEENENKEAKENKEDNKKEHKKK